ncbi:Hexose transport-related protein [Mycena indigotica]|uniref:Hexose transport-related protein n=1 Tax=Mycena indigotica TaxID=2126181 RepID=A0A8H6S817_9AGAR|nr:Hexose transport-related protein [Mycena indigotica]KAF7294568.1 Hexose transport-related protein [Mycena indigotica]
MGGLQAANAARRAELAGPAGIRGLMQNPRLFRLAIITTLGALCYGYEQGAYSQVLVMDAFVNDRRFARIANDSSFKGWSVSTLGLGGWAGALSNGYLCDIISRRWTLFVGAMICLLGTALTTGAQNAAWMFVGRFFIGWAVGSLSAAVPLYNSEISPPELRGTVVSIQQLAIVTGICISFWVGFGTNFISETNSASWRVCLAGQGVPSLALALLSFTLPYTPRWLIRRGRNEEALSTLAWLRKMPEDSEIVQLEYTEIQAEALFEAETTAERFPGLTSKDAWTQFKLQIAQFGELFTTIHMFRRTAVACLTQFFQQMSGIDAIVYYAPSIFSSLGLPGKTVSLLAAGVIGVVFIISTLPAIATIDRVGRRPLLIIGGSGMALMLILVAALTATYQPDWNNSAAGWTTATFIWIYVAFFGTSWGPVSWTVISEVFPLSTRAHGVALGASANWMTNFVVGIVVPDMLKAITYGTYLFFLMFMLMGIAFAYWVLPETFGKSLEEMDLAFGSGEGQEDMARMERILLALSNKEKKHPRESDDVGSSKAEA